ncbi:MAG TPA: hypothetical protein VJ822_05115 [Dongiaceae bacterium]|nr:hypothetical protein [Dongiaceae bacterium]
MSRAASKLAPLVALICTVVLFPAGAAAQAVAILEEIAGASGKHEAFDELKAGERLDLGANGRAVIGYLGSCARETIDGGTVTIGKNQSQIEGGKVARETIPCEATQLVLSEAEAGKSATVSMRPMPWDRELRQIVPSLSPLIWVEAKGQLAIKRLDTEEQQTQSLPIEDGKVDLTVHKIELVPNGYYELKAGEKRMVIKIHSNAQAGAMPAMSRLVRL